MSSGIFPATGKKCRTGCSGTGEKFPAICTPGSTVFGNGCFFSRVVSPFSIASNAIAAAFWNKFQFRGVAGEDEEEEGDSG